MGVVKQWMSWEGGIDLVAVTRAGLAMPNVIVHVARVVHTPVGSAPSGMILLQLDPEKAPVLMGFISTDVKVGKYFGANIFAGTPFEQAPVLEASIEVEVNAERGVARVKTGGFSIESRLSGMAPGELIHRAPAGMTPFYQQGVEAVASRAELKVNGEKVEIIVPPVGITGGPAAVISHCGVFAR